jgi:serine/threonine-protein kinase
MIFKNKNTTNENPLELHEEETTLINPKPSVKKLKKNITTCSSCKKDFSFAELTGLALRQCPHCNAMNFIPMRIKDFWLYEPIGGGGMGSVYKAFIEYNPDIEAALKVLPRMYKENKAQRDAMLNEGKTGFLIGDHPHLVKVVDFGAADDEYFIAMEYIEGIRLDRIIASPVPRPHKQIFLWALQILSAEQHIFDKGYLFRDLKPQNIIITNQGNAKLVDYGLAIKVEEAIKNNSSQITGSPHYLPPERIMGEGEYLYSEIYSLGMVLFHVITRKTFYTATEIKQLINKHAAKIRIGNVAGKMPAGIDPELIRVISKMIERSPQKRYQSFKETARDLLKLYQKCA